MTDHEKDSKQVPLLTGDANFPQWVRRMACLLISKNLHDAVGMDPRTFAPKAKAPDINDTGMAMSDLKAKALIELRLSDATLIYAEEATSAHGLWKTLHATFQRSSIAARVTALKALIATSKQPEQSINDYVVLLRNRAAAVANAGIKVGDDLLVGITLANLPEEYTAVVISLDTIDDLTMSKVTNTLLNAEKTLVNHETTRVEGNTVTLLQREIAALKAASTKPKSTCSISWHRHAGGDDNCYAKHPELNPRNKLTKPQPYDSAYFLSLAPTCSSALTARQQSDWVLADSGCSNHMFHDRSVFRSYQPLNGPSVNLGDDTTIPSSGMGSVTFAIGDRKIDTDNVLHVPDLGKNLFSLGQSTGKGIKYLLDGKSMIIYRKDHFCPPSGSILAVVPKGPDNLYRMSNSVIQQLASTTNSNPPAASSPPATPAARAPPAAPAIHTGPMASFASQRGPVSRKIWLQRLGLVNQRDFDRLLAEPAHKINVLKVSDDDPTDLLEPSILAKMTRFPFSSANHKTTHAGEIIFSDVKGPIATPGVDGGWRYFVTYIDCHTRFLKIFLLKRKSDQSDAFKTFEATICNKFKTNIACVETLHTDNGGEYMSNADKAYFRQRGILHRTTVAGNPQSNGVAERINRTIFEIAEAMRIMSNLPRSFWSLFVFHAVYLYNRRPHSALNGITPYQAWWGHPPTLRHLRVPGCDAWALTPVSQRRAQDHHARRGIFVGYAPTQKGYRLFNPATNKIMISTHTLFNEKSFTFGRDRYFDEQIPSTPGPQPSVPAVSNLPDEVPDDDLPLINHRARPQHEAIPLNNQWAPLDDDDDDNDNNEINGPIHDNDDDHLEHYPPASAPSEPSRYPQRERHPPGQWWEAPAANTAAQGPSCEVTDACQHIHHYAFNSFAPRPPTDNLPRPCLDGIMASDIDVNLTLRQALNGPYGGYFSDAAHKEFRSLLQFRTWELRHLPKGRKAIGNKWVFKIKAKDDGSIDKFKARLVIQGFSQRPGIDFDETFAPVAHQESTRLLIALAAQHGYKTRHIDIVGAFLNGDMEEDVFMKQPDGFIDPENKDLVCKLLKALYGLRQAGNVWNKRFHNFLVKMGFVRISADPCIYILQRAKSMVILALHVDDCLMINNDNQLCDAAVRTIASEFEITDLGEPTKLLGMRVCHDHSTGAISLDQETYILEILKRFNMFESKPSDLPHVPNLHLSSSMSPSTPEATKAMQDIPYGEAVGALLWLSICTRPELKPAVSVLCRFIKNPGPQHWSAVKLVFRYLRGSTKHGLRYSRDPTNPGLIGYADSDFANDPDKSRSVGGYVVKFANAAIAWKSKLQSTVATSSTHAEYMALYDCAREIVWLRQLLVDINHATFGPTTIFEDNRGCISMTANMRTDPKTKHVNVKYHYTRGLVQDKTITIEYKATADMIADLMTKPLDRPKFLRFRPELGVHDLST